MKKILVVVDMQNDFIDGPLGTPEARAIIDRVCEKIRGEEWDHIYYTLDTHDNEYLETQEGEKLPITHCVKHSPGWMLNKDVMIAIANSDSYEKIEKHTFGSIGLEDRLRKINTLPEGVMVSFTDIQHHVAGGNIELTLIGVCTDICVISNALLLKTHFPEMKIVVDASCCAGTTPEKHVMALEVMKSCQIDILNEVNGDQIDVVNDEEPSLNGAMNKRAKTLGESSISHYFKVEKGELK